MSLISRLIQKRPVDPIESLLRKASSNQAGREQFYRMLLEVQLWTPGEIHDGELFIRPYELEGRKTLLLFSSPQKLDDALRDSPPRIELPGQILLSNLPPFDSLILNYRTAVQKEMTPTEVRAMLDGTIHDLDMPDGRMMLGQPRDYPVRLMEQLVRMLPEYPQVTAAYLCQIVEEYSSEQPRILIALEAASPDSDLDPPLQDAAATAIRTGNTGIRIVSLVDDAIGAYLKSETKPFYAAEG